MSSWFIFAEVVYFSANFFFANKKSYKLIKYVSWYFCRSSQLNWVFFEILCWYWISVNTIKHNLLCVIYKWAWLASMEHENSSENISQKRTNNYVVNIVQKEIYSTYSSSSSSSSSSSCSLENDTFSKRFTGNCDLLD